MIVAIYGPSSRSAPMPLVNIEFHRTLVAHLQKERLAVVLMPDVDALHDLEGFQGLFAKRNQNFFSISHWIPLELLAPASIRVVQIAGNGCVT